MSTIFLDYNSERGGYVGRSSFDRDILHKVIGNGYFFSKDWVSVSEKMFGLGYVFNVRF